MPAQQEQAPLLAQHYSFPPPILGWNTKDSLVNMDHEYAVQAINYFSNGSTVDLRAGYSLFASSIGSGVIGSTFEWIGNDATHKLLAIGSNGRCYDISAGGGSPTDLSSAGTLLNNAITSSVNFKGKVFIKDRFVHHVYDWDGAGGSLHVSAFTGPGGDDLLLANPTTYKGHIVFTGADASFWYGGLLAETGALTQVDLKSIFTLGGQLWFAGPVNKQGPSDQQYFAAISSEGEVLLYQGDLGTVTFILVGQYYMPPPLGSRAFVRWGSELLVITLQGILPLSQVIKGGTTYTYISEKIGDQFLQILYTANSAYVNGIYWPAGNMLIFNIPSAANNVYQFVMNATTGSWWLWDNIQSYQWTLFNGTPYFVGSYNGQCFKFGSVYYDEDPSSAGAALARPAILRPAYTCCLPPRAVSSGQSPGPIKQFVEAEVQLMESEGLNLIIDGDVDYANVTPMATKQDLSDLTYKYYSARCGLNCSGKAISVRFDGNVTTKRRSIMAITVKFIEGTQI